MSNVRNKRKKQVLEVPLTENDRILAEGFFSQYDVARNDPMDLKADGQQAAKKEKPTHYKIVSFSMYNDDIDHLEELVAKLKAKGVTKASKSQVVRYALAMVDVDSMPRSY